MVSYLNSEAKEVENLLNLFKPLSKHGIPLGTPFASAPLFQVPVVVDTSQFVLEQLPAAAETRHQVVENVKVLFSPAAKDRDE